MGEAKRRKLVGEGMPKKLGDVRKLSEKQRKVYIDVALERAREIATQLPNGETLYAAFDALLRFVVGSTYLGGCHDTSALLYLQLREVGLQEADIVLCIGEVKVQSSRFDHSWVEVRGQVFDVAICAPNKQGNYAGGAVFANIDLSTNAPTQAEFGVASDDPLGGDADKIFRMNLSKYLEFQQSMNFKSLVTLAETVYQADVKKMLARYGDVYREWRNPQLNPQGGSA